MPIVSIPIQTGPNQNVDEYELANGTASVLENMLITDAGANIGRPALSSFAEISGTKILAHTTWADKLFVVGADRNFYSVNSGGLVTNITGADGPLVGVDRPYFDNDGTYLAIAGGGIPQRWDGVNPVENMPGSPPATKVIKYFDGYWVAINDDGDMQWAGPSESDRESWSTGNFFQAEALPDDPLTLGVNLRELFIFGEESTETWQNFGDVSVPFRRSFFIERGVASRYSVVKEDNTLWFLGNDGLVYVFNGRTPQAISYPFDKVIQDFTTLTDCFGSQIQFKQFRLLTWTFPSENKTFVFDAKRREYIGEWSGFVDGIKRRFPMNSHAYLKSTKSHYVSDFRDGKIWNLSFSNYSDGTDPRRCIRRTGVIDHGTANRKRNTWYDFHVKRGVATSSVSDPNFVVRFRDDDKPWSNDYLLSLGAVGDATVVRRLHNTGTYRKRQIEVICTDAVEFSLLKIEENVEALIG